MIDFFYKLKRNNTILVLCICLTACLSDEPNQQWIHDNRGLYAAQFSDDGDLLLIASVDKSAQLWDFHEFTQKHAWTVKPGTTSDFAHVALSQDATTAVTATTDSIIVWDTASGKSTGNWSLNGLITKLAISENGTYALVAYANRSAQLIDLRYGSSAWKVQHAAYIETIALSEDAAYALIGCDDNTATLWNIKLGTKEHIWEEQNKVRYVAISPKNSFAITSSPFASIKIWNIKTGQLQFELKEYNNYLFNFLSKSLIHISSATFSDNEQILLTGSPPRNLHVWDMQNGKLIDKFIIPKHSIWKPTAAIVYATAISGDNKTIFAEASNGMGYAWDIK